MKNLKQLSFLVVGIAFMALACSKGATGPQGPKGATGPGSVTYSNWITLALQLNTSDSLYEQKISAPSITQSILDSGVILTYLSIVDNNNVTNVVNASVYFFNEIFTPGSIDLGSVTDYTGFSYRYVVVPGSVKANKIVSGPAQGLTKDQLQNMSYEAVQKLLGSPSSAGAN